VGLRGRHQPERLGRLGGVWRGAGHAAGPAAAIAVVVPVAEDALARGMIRYDLGQATMSMMLAAADAGIGGAHAAVTDQDLARDILGFPEGRFCARLVAPGRPADRPLRPVRVPNRRPFDQVVHRERW